MAEKSSMYSLRELDQGRSCSHDYPKEVEEVEGGGYRIRCLGCLQLGPVAESLIAARDALLSTNGKSYTR